MPEIRIVIPTFDGRLSKNDRLARGRYGDSSIKRLKDSFALLIRAYGNELIGCKKLDVELIVYRPSEKWDAHNFLDEFCDIIQMALGINDRNFTPKVTPELDPMNPHFELILKGE